MTNEHEKVSDPLSFPLRFNDPIANKVGWSPVKRLGYFFRTHKLYEAGVDRLEFRLAFRVTLFCLLFMFVGSSLFFLQVMDILLEGSFIWSDYDAIIVMLIGLAIASVGGVAFRILGTPRVFDKKNGYFWKSRKAPDYLVKVDSMKHIALIDNIYALQLVSERCGSTGGDGAPYDSYELNLILKDANRINVVDHGNKESLRGDASRLSDFLDVPLWDAIDLTRE